MGFSRQEYWSGLPCPSPGDGPDPGIQLAFLSLLHQQAGVFLFLFSLTTSTPGCYGQKYVPMTVTSEVKVYFNTDSP